MRCVLVSLGVVLLAHSVSTTGSVDVSSQITPPRATTPAAPKGTAVLSGTVVAVDTGAPIRRVQVRAMTSDGKDNQVALTDEQGRFELRELAGGRYTVMASRSGFVGLQYGQRRPNERGTPVEVLPGQRLDKLTIALPRGGVIAGRVMDEFGEPLAEVQVQVLRSMMQGGGRRMMPAGRGDNTDDQGAFRIFGLQPGEYVVSATLRNESSMNMTGKSGTGPEQGYAPTYYPGTPTVADAQRVSVGVGQEVTGVAFGLTPTRVARISGRVVGGTREGAQEFVSLTPDEPLVGGFGMGGGGGPVQPDGTFEIGGVAPGRYILRTQPRGPRDGDTLVGMTTVTVAGADLAGIVLTLQRPGVLRGVFEFEGGVPAGVQPTQVRAQLVPADPASSRFFTTGPPSPTNADFTFAMQGLMAPVLVRANAPPGWYLHSVVHNGEDITDTPVPMGPGVEVRDVRVRLTQTVSTLSGTVRDERGQLVLDAAVVVFPADDAKWGFASRFVRTARPDTQGRFEVRTLPAHANYRIIALQGLEDGQASDPEFLASLRDRAERLTLNEGETKSVDLRLRQ
jgi:Carboxypeptidase regulatory-like domain